MSTNEQVAQEQGPKHEVTLDQALELAQGHHQIGNLMIADRTYRDILRAVPDHFPTVHYLATLLYQRGNEKEALEMSEKAVHVAPEDKSCWVNHGVLLAANGRYEDSIDAFDQALTLDPELYEAYSNKAYALFEMKRYEEAEDTAAQAISFYPDVADAYVNMGIALAAQGKLAEAEEVWEQVAGLEPDSSRIYSNWSNTLREQGNLDEAKEKALRAVGFDEENSEARNNLANALRDLGQLDEAVQEYRRATDAEPSFYLAHSNLSMALIDQERYAEAVVAARYAIAFKDDYAPAFSNMGLAYHAMGKFEEAYAATDRAIQIEPEEAGHYLNMADILMSVDRYDEGEAVMEKALALEPDTPRTLLKLADIQQNLDHPDEAIAALDKAIEINPEMPLISLQKARVLQQNNRVEEALDIIEGVLLSAENNPHAILAKIDCLLTMNRKEEARPLIDVAREVASEMVAFYYNLTAFKKFTADDPDFIKMKELGLKSDEYGLQGRASIHFALFKAYENVGDYEKAFDALEKANVARGEMRKIPENKTMQLLAKRKETYTPKFIKDYEGKGCESDMPIFILGMPRSGTTLTEQIISSHPDVYGAGELPDLSVVLREMGPLTPANAREMGEAYVERVRALDKEGTARYITDKMPGHCNNIGLIHSILPNAKIILCRRNPIDNCLSCYKQNFAKGHYWTYDQEGLARHYNEFAALMEYWKELLPGRFMEVHYEETVGNFEEQARKLIDYVGLAWDDACLAPHKQKRAVLTASKDQVIKPVYQTSVAAWKRYEKQLQPLIQNLDMTGYED